MWDVCSAKELAVLDHESHMACVSFSPTDNRFLSTALDSKTISMRHWDDTTGGLPKYLVKEQVFFVRMSHDGTMIASGTKSGVIFLHNAESGQELGVGSH